MSQQNERVELSNAGTNVSRNELSCKTCGQPALKKYCPKCHQKNSDNQQAKLLVSHSQALKMTSAPLIVEASSMQLASCPLKLPSNRQKIIKPHLDVSSLTDDIRGLSVQPLSRKTALVKDNAAAAVEPIETTVGTEAEVHYYKGPGKSVLMCMPHPCQLQFCGYLKVTILYGHVYIFGNNLNLHSRKQSVVFFGATSDRSIMIETKASKPTDNSILKQFLSSHIASQASDILSNVRPEDAVIYIEEQELSAIFKSKLYVPEDLYPITNAHTIFPEISQWLECRIDGAVSNVYEHQHPTTEEQNLSLSKRMMVVGGGRLGKSTFCKLLINRLLETHDGVLYFELDIGQGDYLPPGTVGTFLIREPAVGPAYTRIYSCERMIHLGEIDVYRCKVQYVKSVQRLIQDTSKGYEDYPVVINTMGLTNGHGYELTVELIRMLKPLTLLQIEVENCPKSNFKNHFSREVIVDVVPGYELRVIKPFYPVLDGIVKPRDVRKRQMKRNLKILLSLEQLLGPPHYTFNSVKPLRVSFSSIMIGVGNSFALQDILRVLNGSLVSLCETPRSFLRKLESNQDYFQIVLKPHFQYCLGLGLVRGIDVEKKELYLITALTVREMQRVKMLTISNVHVPSEVFCDQNVEGTVPYVARNLDARANAPIVRVHRSPNQKRS